MTVHDPLLSLVGRHTIEVRGRTTGDYRSLDPKPLALTVDIQPLDQQAPFGAQPHGDSAAPSRTGQPVAEALDEAGPRVGCGTVGMDGSLGAALLCLGLIGLVRIRRRCGARP